jgi:hypothetical protein
MGTAVHRAAHAAMDTPTTPPTGPPPPQQQHVLPSRLLAHDGRATAVRKLLLLWRDGAPTPAHSLHCHAGRCPLPLCCAAPQVWGANCNYTTGRTGPKLASLPHRHCLLSALCPEPGPTPPLQKHPHSICWRFLSSKRHALILGCLMPRVPPGMFSFVLAAPVSDTARGPAAPWGCSVPFQVCIWEPLQGGPCEAPRLAWLPRFAFFFCCPVLLLALRAEQQLVEDLQAEGRAGRHGTRVRQAGKQTSRQAVPGAVQKRQAGMQ